MSDKRFTTIDLYNGDGEITHKSIICDNGKSMSNKQAADKLNEYGKLIQQKNKEIHKLKEREENFQMVIGGVIGFIRLRLDDFGEDF